MRGGFDRTKRGRADRQRNNHRVRVIMDPNQQNVRLRRDDAVSLTRTSHDMHYPCHAHACIPDRVGTWRIRYNEDSIDSKNLCSVLLSRIYMPKTRTPIHMAFKYLHGCINFNWEPLDAALSRIPRMPAHRQRLLPTRSPKTNQRWMISRRKKKNKFWFCAKYTVVLVQDKNKSSRNQE